MNNRVIQIDSLRGCMLLIMTLDHLLWVPFSFLSNWTNVTFGFAGYNTAAEGFVLLSGITCGLIFTRRLSNSTYSYANIRHWAWKRSGFIYLIQTLVFVIVLALILSFPETYNQWGNLIFVAARVNEPVTTFILGQLFLGLHGFSDVLPVYMLLLLTTPLVIRSLDNKRYVILISLLLWMFSQLNPQEFILGVFKEKWPNEPWYFGAFDIMAWQLLFVAGISLGYSSVRGTLSICKSPWLIFGAIIFSGFMLVHRHSPELQSLFPISDALLNRKTLASLILLNLASMSYLIYVLNSVRPQLFKITSLAYIGRHSLHVFCFQLLIIYLLMPFSQLMSSFSLYLQVLFLGLSLLSLWIPAYLHQKWQNWATNRVKNPVTFSKPPS